MGHFFEELKRRGVFRIGAAYLAVAWLLLQVLDVLRDTFVLHDWIGRFTFFALLIGFPFALILAWVYEITPEGVKPAGEVEAPLKLVRFGGRKIDFVIIGALSLVIVLLVVDNYVMRPGRPADSDGPPMVSGYEPLTNSPILFPPTGSQFPMVADDSRLYFPDWETGRMGMRQMLLTGGETHRVVSPFDNGKLFTPNSMTPDGSHLLINVFNPESDEKSSIWLLPVVGGQPRRLGEGANGSYSPDGRHLVYTNEDWEIFLARADLTEPRKLVTAHGKVHWLAFSPDGRRIRFHAPRNGIDTIWEFSADGTNLHAVLPEWEFKSHCCGSWTPDGKYYVFQATQNFRTQIWAIRENQGPSSANSPKPVQITTGALDFIRPTIAADGKKIFAIGWQLRGEVVHRDSASGLYVPVPGLESLSAEWLAYSRDEQWVAYVSYPEAELWRSKSDGNSRLQLTQAPMRVADPNWSPDGQSLAFSGQMPGQDWKIYIVSAEGGKPRSITAENWEVWSPAWSPDGTSLAFSAVGKNRIQILNIATGAISELEGSDDLVGPKWSPDGRYLAAWSEGSIALFDMTIGLTESLLENVKLEDFYWANDGQHVYFYDPFWVGPDRSVHRVGIVDKTVAMVARTGGVRPSWGVANMWVGIAPDGAPLLLRDLSIHHIYALDWLPDIGTKADSSQSTE